MVFCKLLYKETEKRRNGSRIGLAEIVKPAIHFTDKLDVLEREKEKSHQNLWKSAKWLVVVGIPSGVKSERKIRRTLKEANDKNYALRRLKPPFEGSIN
ncbi:hypothetical protein AVEN_220570-1 [Araneus ventricosus]|uniref:Uncharacterized protein n=1 Tax=Araneus ventricosus TaxID=182803 RepID=A0A4Y2AG87_ARAVE|nr:hypothetical protein AVEN_253881-1 [Araneus ventricosus]GBL78650.1 hypothetical protein AVEN_31914-1 [Araneus ventricosus]GBL78654.1 hypothetical protein AVEN_33830-1 [Araneus ventricosus]GBL78823.1 hypothetical protein AVEN_220570-1 [Araneus ventricosus]